MKACGVKTIRGVTLRSDPAREDCFTVVHIHAEMHDYPDMSEASRRQRLHRHMHNEMQSLEIAAQSLADFSDAPWDLRLQLARQCWDETRHTSLLYRRLKELGGHKGEFPVMNFEWGVTCMLDSLPARLAVQNRTFEAGEMDLLRQLVNKWDESEDETTSEIMAGILADEIQHVRFANQWLKHLASTRPRILLQVAKGVRFLKSITEALAPQPGEMNAVGVDLTGYKHLDVFANVEDRRLAEFTEEEIAEILMQEGFGSLIPQTTAARS
jgi:uncharacterized ferritin-like protein (DUF455 family)